jgi:hypothetical protein
MVSLKVERSNPPNRPILHLRGILKQISASDQTGNCNSDYARREQFFRELGAQILVMTAMNFQL